MVAAMEWDIAAPLLAVVLAMLALALVVISGAWLLRRLQIVSEAPEHYRFMPAAPRLIHSPDPQRAQLQASRRRQLATRYRRAQAVWESWLSIVDATHSLAQVPGGVEAAADAQQLLGWRREADTWLEQLDALLPQLAGDAADEGRLLEIEQGMAGVYSQVEALWLARQGHGKGRRSYLLLLLFLGIVLAWLVILTMGGVP